MTLTAVAPVTFKIGMSVRIKFEMFEELEEYFRNLYGEGTFPMVGVCDVPRKRCNCKSIVGQEAYKHGYHDSHCALEEPDYVGHHQWVIVRINGKDREFSGKLLEPVLA